MKYGFASEEFLILSSIYSSVSIVRKLSELQLLVIISMGGLCTGGGSKCLELILNHLLGNHTSYGGQKVWIFKREVSWQKSPYCISIAGNSCSQTLQNSLMFWMGNQKMCILHLALDQTF